MQLVQLQYFCTLARLGSMHRAAEELFVSQPGLSKAIASLESEIGVKLFKRTSGRNIELNEAGQLFYNRIISSLYQINEAIDEVRELELSHPKELKVLFTAANFISSWLRTKYHERYPDLSLVFKSSYSAGSSDVIGFDFHIFATPAHYEDVEYIELLEEPFLLAMGHDHPLAAKNQITLLDTMPFAYQSLPEDENISRNLINFCSQAGFKPNIVLRTEDSFSFFSGLATNGLIAMLPAHTVFTVLKEGIVVKPIVGQPECKRSIRLGWNKDCTITNDMQNFIDFCREIFDQDHPNMEGGE